MWRAFRRVVALPAWRGETQLVAALPGLGVAKPEISAFGKLQLRINAEDAEVIKKGQIARSSGDMSSRHCVEQRLKPHFPLCFPADFGLV